MFTFSPTKCVMLHLYTVAFYMLLLPSLLHIQFLVSFEDTYLADKNSIEGTRKALFPRFAEKVKLHLLELS